MTAPPPTGSLVRQTRTGAIWHARPDGTWESRDYEWLTTGNTMPILRTISWDTLASGEYGELELLVPVPLGMLGADDEAALAQLVEGVVNPVGTMLVQLAQAAAAGVLAITREAHRRGEAAGHIQGHGVGWSQGWDDARKTPQYEPPPVATGG